MHQGSIVKTFLVRTIGRRGQGIAVLGEILTSTRLRIVAYSVTVAMSAMDTPDHRLAPLLCSLTGSTGGRTSTPLVGTTPVLELAGTTRNGEEPLD